jgi:cardiolipin synthase
VAGAAGAATASDAPFLLPGMPRATPGTAVHREREREMGIAGIVGLSVLGFLLLAFAVIGALQSTRGTPIERVSAGGDGERLGAADADFATIVGALTQTALRPGNAVAVLANGDETYPRLWADLRAATRSISMQVYYAMPGRMADELATILTERARAGVEVRFLYDALGAHPLGDDYIRALCDAGVRACVFRPMRWYSPHLVQHRSHARVVVIDGVIAYGGGFGIADKWYGNGRRSGEWRDTNVRCTGPVVRQFQAAFAAGWAESTGELLLHRHLYPEAATGEASASEPTCVRAGLLFGTPTIGSTAVERFLAATIAGAAERLYIANAYFAPDDDLRRFLCEAAGRGVDVRVLTAGDESDVGAARHAGRARYEELLEGGVRIYEYRTTMMHAKTMVVDGVWCTVGSLNLDNRGIALNDEALLIAHDRALGARLESLYLDDLRHATEVDLPEFRQRGLRQRLLEAGVNVLSRWI